MSGTQKSPPNSPAPDRTFRTPALNPIPESASLAELQAGCARAIGQLVLEATGDLSRSSAVIHLLDAYIPGLLEVWVILPRREFIALRDIENVPRPDPDHPDLHTPGLRRLFFRVPGHDAWLVLARSYPFTRVELRAAIEVAAAVSVVLELRAALLQRTRVLKDDFDLLVSATQEISRCQGLEELYEAIAREGQRLLKQRRHNLICLQRYSNAFEEITCVSSAGDDAERLNGLRLSTDLAKTRVKHYPRYINDHIADELPRQNALSFTGSLIKSGADYLLIADVAQRSADAPYYSLSARTRSEMAVPIVMADGSRWGVLNVENPHPNAFSEFFDLPLLQGFARIIAVFIQELERRDKTYTLDDISLPGDLKRAIKLFAFSDESVLLTGETGTGKEVVARALHYGGARRKARFIPVNCGAIEPNLMMSELFGYTAHSFSGAGSKDKTGLFQASHNGTIFLDEVENMPMPVQEAVLRVVERGEIRKVGNTQVEQVEVRVIAASNVDLRAKIQEGTFRQDLYYRLKILEITLPPLRDRPEFIPELFWSFVDQYRKPLQKVEPDPLLLEALKRYAWPGNVRELKNLVKRLLVFSNAPTVDLLPEEIRSAVLSSGAPSASSSATPSTPALTVAATSAPGKGRELSEATDGPASAVSPLASSLAAPSTSGPTGGGGAPGASSGPAAHAGGLSLVMHFDDTSSDVMSHIERQIIQEALNHFNGDRYRVASFLGISPPSVYRKIKAYGIKEARHFE